MSEEKLEIKQEDLRKQLKTKGRAEVRIEIPELEKCPECGGELEEKYGDPKVVRTKIYWACSECSARIYPYDLIKFDIKVVK